MSEKREELKKRILELKRKKNAVILAHFYTIDEVQEIADFTGDSLALSQQAASTDAEVILFAGVHFMAETAKILSPTKKVLIPDPQAGCSLADSCNEKEFARFIDEHPDHLVVSYVNTSVEVKALTDICCTSSNAVKVIDSIDKEQKIIFGPDRNLGNYIKRVTSREDMVVWDGACHVHEDFSLEKILELKKQYPQAEVVAHPECKKVILLVADFVGSTSAILDYCGTSSAETFIVVTESGILYQMQKQYPQKRFIPAPPIDSTCGCNNCSFMKLVTLEKIYQALLDESPEVKIDEQVRIKAERSILNMLKIK